MSSVNPVLNYEDSISAEIIKPPWYATFPVIQRILENGSFEYLVWPDEGRFYGEEFVFNARHEEDGFEPLLMDIQTANMLVTVHDAMNEKNQRKFERMVIKSRGAFGMLLDFGWPRIKTNKEEREKKHG